MLLWYHKTTEGGGSWKYNVSDFESMGYIPHQKSTLVSFSQHHNLSVMLFMLFQVCKPNHRGGRSSY